MADAAPPRLVLARHGETEMNRLLRCQGWLDAPLNDRGWDQARRLAERMAEAPVARVVASPLQRAHMTARIVAAQHGLAPEGRLELREMFHGRLEGVPFLELDRHVPGIREAWRTRPHEVCMPDGETLAQLQARAWPAFQAIAEEHLGTPAARDGVPGLLFVAHALTIGTILCRLRGEPLSRIRDYRVLPCGYWELAHDGEGWQVVRADGRLEED